MRPALALAACLFLLPRMGGAEPPGPLRAFAVTNAAGSLDSFRIVARSRLLSARINALLPDAADRGEEVSCELGVANEAFVSWRCRLSHCPTEPGAESSCAAFSTARAFFIDSDRLRRATMVDLFVSRPDLLDQLGKIAHKDWELSVESIDAIFVGRGTIAIPAGDGHFWEPHAEALVPFLREGNPVTRYAEEDGEIAGEKGYLAAARKIWKGGVERFVATDGGVLDQVTGLEWAASDNGADLDRTMATAHVTAHRGGGHTDWRLPSLGELADLADVVDAHRDPADCTKGRAALAITPLIHVTCDLVWARDGAYSLVARRERKPSGGKHLRALAVRDARWIKTTAGILDRVSGLEWAAANNGSDVSQSEAAAYAAELPRGAGEPAWRLPTVDEAAAAPPFTVGRTLTLLWTSGQLAGQGVAERGRELRLVPSGEKQRLRAWPVRAGRAP